MKQTESRNWFRAPENANVLRLEKEGRKHKVGSVQKMQFDAGLFKKIEATKQQLRELREQKEHPEEKEDAEQPTQPEAPKPQSDERLDKLRRMRDTLARI